MAYVTLEALKRYLKIATGVTVDDTLLTELIADATSIINAYTDRVFEASVDTVRRFDAVRYREYADRMQIEYYQYFDYYDQRVLWLGKYDLAQITSIVNGDGTTVASTEYVTLPINAIADGRPIYGIRLKLDSDIVWTWNDSPDAAIVVTGRWAYSVTCPGAISFATKRLAQYLYKQKDTSAELDRTIYTADGMVVPNSLPADVVQYLEPYKRLVI
jgi:hypothetical protein